MNNDQHTFTKYCTVLATSNQMMVEPYKEMIILDIHPCGQKFDVEYSVKVPYLGLRRVEKTIDRKDVILGDLSIPKITCSLRQANKIKENLQEHYRFDYLTVGKGKIKYTFIVPSRTTSVLYRTDEDGTLLPPRRVKHDTEVHLHIIQD